MSYAAYGLGLIVMIGLGTFLIQIFMQRPSSDRNETQINTFKTSGLRSPSLGAGDQQSGVLSKGNLSQAAVDHLRDQHDINIDGIDDTVTATVECKTTKGDLVIDVRGAWAPLGSEQFLKLADKEFFSNLPFFRVCPRYITQFGAKYGGNRVDGINVIQDDPPLWGKRDMDFGYVFFAGSGPNSRYNEMVIALCMTKGCKISGLGNAPWEVPLGTIRKEGFPVLQEIAASGFPYPRLEMPGQTPKAGGPDRTKLERQPNYLKENYPDMVYFKECKVSSRNQHISRPLSIDHPDTDMTLNIINMSNSLNSQSSQSVAKADVVSADAENSFFAKFTIATSQGEGDVMFQIFPNWAPLGASRFRTLVDNHYFDGVKFFRVIKKFMAQFGINGDPSINNKWNKEQIHDDPFLQTNARGTISFATSGPNTRSTQLFVNLVDNKYLDKNFEPIGKVIVGMQYIDQVYDGYGEGGSGDGTDGRGPNQGRIAREGNAYLDRVFPKLSTIISAQIMDKYEI